MSKGVTTSNSPAPVAVGSSLGTSPAAADRELKDRHRAMWASGDYPTVAELIGAAGVRLADALDVSSGDRFLDIAAGAGNAAIPAARRGGLVTALDLTPELLTAGQQRAEDEGLNIDWVTGDAEALPFEAASFDVVASCVGVMFAPHHQPAADEIVRVCRPGGRLGLISWTPTGFIGELFATMAPFAAPPSPGAQSAIRWGEQGYVRGLLAEQVDLRFAVEHLTVDRFAAGVEFCDFFTSAYGPAVAVCRGLAADPERLGQLRGAVIALADRYLGGTGSMQWEYLLVTGRVAWPDDV